MSNDAFELNNKGLKQLIAMLKEQLPVAKLGILGDKTNREDGFNTNAAIGAKHEFGDTRTPVRSFLRVPLIDNFQQYMEKAGAFDQEAFEQVLKEKSFLTYAKKIGIIGEQVVSDAFDTGGFGKWKPSNFDLKGNDQTLVETQQLRNSITSKVDE